MAAVIINFMDGRWSKSVLEPKRRIKEGWDAQDKLKIGKDPFYFHSIYFTSALRWWTNALGSVNDQLIAYVSLPIEIPLIMNSPNTSVLGTLFAGGSRQQRVGTHDIRNSE